MVFCVDCIKLAFMKRIIVKTVLSIILIILVYNVFLFIKNMYVPKKTTWLLRAIVEQNPALCDNINVVMSYDTVEQERYFCKAKYGGMSRDKAYCINLESIPKYPNLPSQQDVCFDEIAKKAEDVADCIDIPVSRALCYKYVAINTQNAQLCLQLTKTVDTDLNLVNTLKTECLLQIAQITANASICKTYFTDNDLDNCVYSIVKSNKDPYYCMFINDTTLRNDCSRIR